MKYFDIKYFICGLRPFPAAHSFYEAMSGGSLRGGGKKYKSLKYI
jgi:hypothetical protein